MAALSGAIVVSVGVVYSPSSLPSKPTTDRSVGTRQPCSAAARSAPTASRSLKQTVIGVGTELDAIAAVVIGGTLLTGGAGTVLGTAVGVALRNVISNVINQVGGLDSNIQSVISGAFLLVVVVVQQLVSGRRLRLLGRRS